MFTREELFEFFKGQYTTEQIINALKELAKVDSGIDPNAFNFHASITERLEQVFDIVSEAIASNKKLSSGSDLAQIEQTAINLANSKAVSIPIDAFKGLIKVLDAEAAVEAVTLYQRRKAIRESVLNQLEANALVDANKQAARRIDALNNLCKDPGVLDQILQDYGLLAVINANEKHLEISSSCSLGFDIDEFLNEVDGEKKIVPKTIGDTQRLAKSLITQSLI